MYKIYVRDQYLNRVAEVDDYQSLELIPRFNSPGAWVMELPTDCFAAKELLKIKAGIVVVRNGKTILSGPVTGRRRNWNKDGDRLTINGKDDLLHLFRNLAYPVPLGPPYTSNAYDVRTGAAETVMKQYVEANIGANARQERRISNLFVAANQGQGKNVTGRARFHNLGEMFASLALAGGDIGFRIVQVGKNLEFQVYQPTDKSKEVLFSPLLGNLQSFEYYTEDPEANYVIVGGGGEGTSRILLEKGDSISISNVSRIESFIDRRDTTDTTELQQAMDEELQQKAQKVGLSISPIDSDSFSFGRDYQLGDRVSVVLTQANEVVDEEEIHYFIAAYQTGSEMTTRVRTIQEKLEVISDVVREIKITVTPEGERITPVIGTPETITNPMIGIFNRMKKMSKRVGNLERR